MRQNDDITMNTMFVDENHSMSQENKTIISQGTAYF